MAIGSQYNEDQIFEEYFKDRNTGLVIDVGAADGQDNSNSFRLIEKGWKGILIEPDLEQYRELQLRYQDNRNVLTFNLAVGTSTGYKTFYNCRQVSTFDMEWRDRCVAIHDVEYTKSNIMMLSLQFILDSIKCPKTIDVLSIDCEAMDQDVLASLDLNVYKPELICIEIPPKSINNYEKFLTTKGNTIFRRLV